jgi:DNA repair photolyase
MVQAQIGLITLDECVSQMFEPHAASPLRRLVQLTALTEGGVATMARMDPILPGITNGPELLDNLMAALAATSVKSIAAGILFLRPGILYWLKSRLRDKSTLARLLDHYRDQQKVMMRGSQYPVWNLPLEARREIFARIGEAATANSIELKICACKNPDLATGSCNIAGTRSGRTPPVRPPCTLSAGHRTIHPSVVEQARQEDCTALISA